jgi:hypothetical protein
MTATIHRILAKYVAIYTVVSIFTLAQASLACSMPTAISHTHTRQGYTHDKTKHEEADIPLFSFTEESGKCAAILLL